MMRSLFSGVSGLRSHQTRMDVIGNNIANVNTTGYKAKSLNFSDMLYQTTQAATGPTVSTGGTNPRQIGLGVKTAAINTSITQEGSSQSTGNPFDIKISGEAFFVVSDGTNTYYTRDGSFNVDEAGNLCMSSNGFIVQGWGVDANGDIVQSSVGNINVMAKNSYEAAATTQTIIKGIVDKNDSEFQSANGKQVNVPVYDSQGYQYNMKFGILPKTTPTSSTRSILNTANAYDLPATLYQVDTSKLSYSYEVNGENRTLAETTSPELIEALNDAIWKFVSAGTAVPGGNPTGTYTLGQPCQLALNLKQFVDDPANADLKNALLDKGILYNITDVKIDFSGEFGYAKDIPTYPLSEDFSVSMISEDARKLFYDDPVAGNPPTCALKADMDKITAIRQVYKNDNDESVTDYVFKDNSTGEGKEIQMPGGTDIPSNLYNDILKVLALKTNPDNKYPTETYTTTETKTGEAIDEGNYTISLLGMSDKNGADVDISTILNGTSSWDLSYDKGDGKFSYVGAAGSESFTVNLSALGPNFSNVTVNMSDTSSGDNGKKCSLEGDKLDGRKMGTMTGVTIGTDGLITALYSNGMSANLGQICVGTFANAMGLENAGDNLYQVTANSGDVSIVDIKASGTGTLTTGVLEMSNVDLSQQFTDMITTQRGFQANSRIITTSDSLLEELVNLKR